MIVKYNILGYLIGEGLSNVFKNKKSTMASIIIMCATMIIFGLFLIIGENVNHFCRQLKTTTRIPSLYERKCNTRRNGPK